MAASASIGIGMLGYAFMGKAHANAYKKLASITWPPPLVPQLVAGRSEDAVAAAEAAVAFEGGAVGTIEATRFATGHRNAFRWEVNGAKGSIAFDMERLNGLHVHLTGSTPGARTQGFRTVLVSEADHPFWEHWWPPGHIIGWGDTFVHEPHHLLTAIRDDTETSTAPGTEVGYRRRRDVVGLGAAGRCRPTKHDSCSHNVDLDPAGPSRPTK